MRVSPIWATKPKVPPPPTYRMKALVVDDAEDVAIMIAAALRRCGIEAHSVSNRFEELLDPRTWEGIDAAVLDVFLGVKDEMSGFDIARMLRKERPGVRIVFLTGADLTHYSDVEGLGDAVLIKPALPADICRQVIGGEYVT